MNGTDLVNQQLKKQNESIDEVIKWLNKVKAENESILKDSGKPEFDFKSKMPVGSVWLGIKKVIGHNRNKNSNFVNPAPYHITSMTYYHAHQIIKAAQAYEQGYGWGRDICAAVKAAEQDGVLQNLE